MMEQLAERRMQRENRTQYDADTHPGYPPEEYHDNTMTAGDEFDDDEASYDSQEDYEDELDEEDEMVRDSGLTARRLSNVMLMNPRPV